MTNTRNSGHNSGSGSLVQKFPVKLILTVFG